MIYDIQSKSDMLSGAVLIAKIPEDDLDKKALYTIQEDKPDFILPFRHRVVDGQIEFVYQVGTQSKLQYLAGDRYPKDYTELWSNVLSPLFCCGDWFLRPYSFVLDIKHLYCDKTRNMVGYVYIPSKKDCSDYYDLKEMATEFSRQISVTDPDLENKVLRAIMMDFNPKTFMQMLKADTAAKVHVERSPSAPHVNVHKPEPRHKPVHDAEKQVKVEISEPVERQQRESVLGTSGEIIIDFPASRKAEKKAKEKTKNDEKLQRKREKQKKRREDMVVTPDAGPNARWQESAETGLRQLSAQGVAKQQGSEHMLPVSPAYAPSAGSADVTQNMSYEMSGAWLRLIGNSHLPPGISVAIEEGEVFTIGRYDTAVGRQQSTFEFDRLTKAVSRRHAAIERRADGYSLVDLASSAGTFFNGQKLPPNTSCKLQSGCRISFGNCGADYIWEQA